METQFGIKLRERLRERHEWREILGTRAPQIRRVESTENQMTRDQKHRDTPPEEAIPIYTDNMRDILECTLPN